MMSERVDEMIRRGIVPSMQHVVAAIEGRKTTAPAQVNKYEGKCMPSTEIIQLGPKHREPDEDLAKRQARRKSK